MTPVIVSYGYWSILVQRTFQLPPKHLYNVLTVPEEDSQPISEHGPLLLVEVEAGPLLQTPSRPLHLRPGGAEPLLSPPVQPLHLQLGAAGQDGAAEVFVLLCEAPRLLLSDGGAA